jgi:hypothetical protein
MRLSALLSKAPENAENQVERFLVGFDEESGEPIDIAPGYHAMISVGVVGINFNCGKCQDQSTFVSEGELSCLVVDDRRVSIDAYLRCPRCGVGVEAWFLLTFRDNLGVHAPAPTVRLERYVDNRRGEVRRVGAQAGAGEFDELLECAQVAHEHRLGRGALAYLRIIFETLTKQVATETGIELVDGNGRRKSFKSLLREVDESHRIIPSVFSKDRYRLYSELSAVVHGNVSEEVALEKYRHCASLVRGVIENVSRNHEMKKATEALGWGEGDVA